MDTVLTAADFIVIALIVIAVGVVLGRPWVR